MITKIAMLQVKKELVTEFEKDFRKASNYISTIDGYIKHTLQKCLEDSSKYVLIVEWKTLEDHTIGFRTSNNYQLWKEALHHYYDPFPIVEHFKTVFAYNK